MTETAPTTLQTSDDGIVIHVEHRTRMIIFGALMLSLFIGALDQTVVGTALPVIVTKLHGVSYYTWVVTMYLLTSTITVPMWGKLNDVYGGKRMLTIGIIIFLVGSALSGISQTMWQLVAFRGLQGIGAGSLFPICLAVIGDLFTPAERGKYQGLFGAVFGLSFIVGPLIGGVFTDTIGWRWVFYVNIPIGIAALIAIDALLPNVHLIKGKAREFDYVGMLLFTLSIAPILIGLTDKGLTDSAGNLYGWTNWRVGLPIISGVLLLGVFLVWESLNKHPIIPLHLFRSRTYAATVFATMFISLTMFSSVIFLPRFYQTVRGSSATASGYQMWPLLLGLISASILSGFFVSKFGKYKWLLISSIVVCCLGCFFASHISYNTPNTQIWLWVAIIGIGIGPWLSVSTVVTQNLVDPKEIGVATSTLTFCRQVGGSIGLAIAGTTFTTSFLSNLPVQLTKHHIPPHLQTVFANYVKQSQSSSNVAGVGNLQSQLATHLPAAIHQFIPALVTSIYAAFGHGLGSVFWDSAFFVIVGFVFASFIKDVPLRGFRTKSGDVVGSTQSTKDTVVPELVAPL